MTEHREVVFGRGNFNQQEAYKAVIDGLAFLIDKLDYSLGQ